MKLKIETAYQPKNPIKYRRIHAMKKGLLSLLLAAVLAIGLMPAASAAGAGGALCHKNK